MSQQLGQQVYIGACENIIPFFRETRPYLNPMIVEKQAQTSLYYSRVKKDIWPENTLPTQIGYRFGRMTYDNDGPWMHVDESRCQTNSCTFNPEKIAMSGSESYQFSLLKRDMWTDKICIESLVHRLFPRAEIDHLWNGLSIITTDVQQEFVRSHYYGAAKHRVVGFGNSSSPLQCGTYDDDAFFIPLREGNEGGYDMRYLFVKCSVEDLNNISYLNLNQLDDALIDLQFERDAFRLDVAEAAGRPMADVLIGDPKIGRMLWEQAKNSGGWWDANTDFTNNQLKLSLGIQRVIGNYTFAYDLTCPRYNADSVYNASLPPFDPTDTSTWPRLVRVKQLLPTSVEIGCQGNLNQDYLNADFVLNNIYMPNAMTQWFEPSIGGYGQAQGQVPNYAGMWEAKNPDWECNINRNQVFFKARWRSSIQVPDPNIMWTYLTRTVQGRNLQTACCNINPNYVAPVTPDCYTCVA